MRIPLHSSEEKIVRAYLQLCYRDGFEKITLDRLAKESKMSLASVRYHFSDPRKTLEDTTLLYVLGRGYFFIEAFMAAEKTKKNFRALQSYVNANFSWGEKHREESSFVIHYQYLLATDNRSRIAQIPYLAQARNRLAEMYYLDRGRGLLPKIEDEAAFLLRLHNLLTGSMIVAGIEGGKTSIDRHRKLVLREIPY
jgi:AcrR family transcriptional regulator